MAVTTPFATVEEAIEEIREGRMVVVVDDEDRENEGDLTIAEVGDATIGVSLIPHTLENTIASGYQPGTAVNLEADILAKYVAKYVAERGGASTGSTGNAGDHPSKEAG